MMGDIANTGMGVMLNHLCGRDRGVSTLEECIAQKISKIEIEENELRIFFEGGKGIKLFDDRQSCCERRYMHTDDDLPYYVGSKLVGVELRDGPDAEDDWGDVKESQFLVVTTDQGSFTIVNYNEHNGYYGGFYLIARWLEDE